MKNAIRAMVGVVLILAASINANAGLTILRA